MITPVFSYKNLFKAITIVLVFAGFSAFSQSKKELQRKKEQLQKDIELTNQLLNQTKRNKSASLNELVTLNKKISYRNELITTINSEIHLVESDIQSVAGNIDSLNSRLAIIKEQYAEMLYYAYRNQSSFSRLMFIFSASDINQAFKRMKYLQQLSEYRIHQKELITQYQDSLSGKKRQLQEIKHGKTQLLTTQEKQKQQLDKEKQMQVVMLNNLSSREKKLRNELKEKQRKQEALAAKIEAIIKKEIETAQAKSKKANNSKVTANNKPASAPRPAASVLSNTPEALKLSNDFESNKGRLPWPVDQGFISSSYGTHFHPVWHDVKVKNNGVDINSAKGAKARAIFEGTVIRVIYVIDKYAVLVQHGEYFTLYSNLDQVFVKANDKVITKQPIGTVMTSADDGKTEIHLEVWRGSNQMDPESWIAKK